MDCPQTQVICRFSSILVILLWLGLSPLVRAEPQDREALKEPVFRVENEAAAAARPSPATTPGAASTEKPAAPPASKPAAKPIEIAKSVDLSSKPPAKPKPVLTPEADGAKLSAAANLSPHPEPPKEKWSQPERLFREALDDADVILQHIRTNIRDYTCDIIKREEVNGEVLPPEYIRAKIRNRVVKNGRIVVPFSVYMKFLSPPSCRGREALFLEGKNNGKMLAKEGGSKRFIPSMWLATDSRFVMKTNRYPITEVGIENLTQRLIERGNADDDLASCEVRYQSGAKVDGRICRLLEIKRPKPKTGQWNGMNVYLAQIFMDEELNVPVRYGAYDWPESPGTRPPVLEEYTYRNLKLNVGLTDADFDHNNPNYNF